MQWEDFKYNCKNCKNTNSISATWFRDNEDIKRHSCIYCGHISVLNSKVIRAKFYNQFYEKTVIVGKQNKGTSAFLIKISAPQIKQFYEIPNECMQILIGRGKEFSFDIVNDNKESNTYTLTIPDTYVSRNHSKLLRLRSENSDTWILSDSQSTNGTFYKDKKLETDDEIILEMDSKISIGKSIIELSSI